MIERGITEALHKAQKAGDKKAEVQAMALASVLAAVKMDGFQDIAIPKEAQAEIKRFSPEAREALEKEGYVVYSLDCRSIRDAKEAGRKFGSTWHKDFPDFEDLPSRKGEVAINTSVLFIPKSNKKTLDEQEEIVAEFSKRLSRKIKGVEAVIGDIADYVELAFLHLDATGENLFGEKYSDDYARTVTPTAGSYVALLGFKPDRGLIVDAWARGAGTDVFVARDAGTDVFVAPLIVPA
jgi:hypothetical protein